MSECDFGKAKRNIPFLGKERANILMDQVMRRGEDLGSFGITTSKDKE